MYIGNSTARTCGGNVSIIVYCCVLLYSLSVLHSIAADFRASSLLQLALGEVGALGPSAVTELLLQAGPSAAKVEHSGLSLFCVYCCQCCRCPHYHYCYRYRYVYYCHCIEDSHPAVSPSMLHHQTCFDNSLRCHTLPHTRFPKVTWQCSLPQPSSRGCWCSGRQRGGLGGAWGMLTCWRAAR